MKAIESQELMTNSNVLSTTQPEIFFDCDIYSQFYYPGIKHAQVFNMRPYEFDMLAQDNIVAIWKVKLKPSNN